MKTTPRQSGFTLVELMMALMVIAIVLGAVATLASAASRADDATEQMGREQAQLRHVLVRVGDLIKQANGVYYNVDHFDAYESGVRLCRDINADGDYADAGEMLWVFRNNGILTVRGLTDENYTRCQNPTFRYGWENGQPRTVAVWFDMDVNGQMQTYCINAHLRVSDD